MDETKGERHQRNDVVCNDCDWTIEQEVPDNNNNAVQYLTLVSNTGGKK